MKGDPVRINLLQRDARRPSNEGERMTFMKNYYTCMYRVII
jgi:hypothetical protein